MNQTPAVLAFVLLVLSLTLLRTRLITEFVSCSLLVFGTRTPGLWLYSLIFLPGTILHELSHWLTAEILQVKTGAISILPDLDRAGNHQRLGSVATARSDPLRGFLIGLAPFLSGIGVLSLLGYLLFRGGLLWWQYALLIYGIGVVGSSMLLSAEDRRFWLPAALFLSLLLLLLHKLNLLSPLIPLLFPLLSQINAVLAVTIVVLLGGIGILFLVRRIIEQVTGKLIVRSKI